MASRLVHDTRVHCYVMCRLHASFIHQALCFQRMLNCYHLNFCCIHNGRRGSTAKWGEVRERKNNWCNKNRWACTQEAADSSRFVTLRSWSRRQGIWCNKNRWVSTQEAVDSSIFAKLCSWSRIQVRWCNKNRWGSTQEAADSSRFAKLRYFCRRQGGEREMGRLSTRILEGLQRFAYPIDAETHYRS